MFICIVLIFKCMLLPNAIVFHDIWLSKWAVFNCWFTWWSVTLNNHYDNKNKSSVINSNLFWDNGANLIQADDGNIDLYERVCANCVFGLHNFLYVIECLWICILQHHGTMLTNTAVELWFWWVSWKTIVRQKSFNGVSDNSPIRMECQAC